MNLDEYAGKVAPNLTRPNRDSPSVTSGYDSDGSAATIRSKENKSTKSSFGGVPISNPKSIGKQTIPAGHNNKSSNRPPYSDSSSDEDDDNYSCINLPTINKTGINIYGEDDRDSKDKNAQSSFINSNLANSRTKDGKDPAVFASQSMQSQDNRASFTTASVDLDSRDVDIEFRSASRDIRMTASGFKNNKYGKQVSLTIQTIPSHPPKLMLCIEQELSSRPP